MNAAFLLMSSAALAGADVTAPPVAHPAHPVPAIVHGGGCDCGHPAVYAAAKPGLFDRMKGKFGKKSGDCGCAPPPCNPCATSIADRPNLFDKIKGRMGHKKGDACGPVCDPCGGAHVVGAPAIGHPPLMTPPVPGGTTVPGGVAPPKEMPKPKDPKEMPKAADPKGGVAVPVPPVTGAGGLTGAGSPY